ncbi:MULTISPECIES: hypothetical protein [Actinoalloteichus]|uniref:Glycosyl hydrolase family 39 n=1 Tax=Actinoalloteichus fjordicus TaxID=1612552 RepID=A0AAC9PQR7_9PSEU|nr:MULTISPECIES: hypothetical protein [Actinoalloteichus]APU13207.1 hypothetical protein UA74_05655 [Actinoalloteichus fjordicus]APU19158.1 hypothetical protein UA75_05660 [Actinoalloteichus sp. GBA129-24]
MTDIDVPVPPTPSVTVDWTNPTSVSKTVLTTHIWTAPPMRRDSPIHDRVFEALRELRADYVRFLPWFTHPTLSVPALEPPTEAGTSWNFGNLDPFVEDFVKASEGRPVVANFATIPGWMLTTPPEYSTDPDTIHWEYENSSGLRDETFTEVADYFFRVASWYIAGGFTDENGVRHESGHRYRFAYWEVLCEPDWNLGISPETYTRLYDAVVERLRPLDPEMRFVGLSLSHVHHDPEYFWYFLDPVNHRSGIPLDAVSYHFYATPQIINPFSPEGNAGEETWNSTFFAQVDAFLDQVRFIDSIRIRLSPNTKTFLNEIGTYLADLMNPDPQIPDWYWTLSGSVHAYLWARCVELGIDLVGVAEFMDYPSMIPGVTLVDWDTGEPNARYQVTKLLLDHFGPGDTHVEARAGYPQFVDARLFVQAVHTTEGERKILIINKGAAEVALDLDEASGTLSFVDVTTGSRPPVSRPVQAGRLTVGPHATAVFTLAAE